MSDTRPAAITSEAERRDFLKAAATIGLGTLWAGGCASSPAASAPTAAPPPNGTGASPTAPAPIPTATIVEAEKLAGIEFSPAEREMMSKTLPDQLGMLKSRRPLGPLPNDLAPALVFDPRLPGARFDAAAKPLVRSNDRAMPDPAGLSDEDLAFAPVTWLSRWIEARRLTSTRLTRIYLDRLERFDSKLQAVVTLTKDRAVRQAAQVDREIAAGKYRGPLHGIPWGAKDLFDTAGVRTAWGAEPFIDRIPTTDAAVVRTLDDAGAVLVAKLSLGALAYGDIWYGGRTNNPWKLDQGSSGSSAGSAAATAAGLVAFGIGTETYGSILSPSMVCGTTGLRPTFGRVSRAGAMALCWSLDKVGPICRTVEDAVLVLSAINGRDPADASSIDMPFNFDAGRNVSGLRVGYVRSWFEPKKDALNETLDLDRRALDALKSAGATLVELDLPDWPYDALLPILLCEAAAAFEDLTRTNQDDRLKWQAPEAWPNTFRQTWFIPGVELIQAERFRRRVMGMIAERFEKVDAILGPSNTTPMCLITNNTGHPQLTLRTGFKPDGTPHGITLWGRLFDEGTLCNLGIALERSLNVWGKRPTL